MVHPKIKIQFLELERTWSPFTFTAWKRAVWTFFQNTSFYVSQKKKGQRPSK